MKVCIVTFFYLPLAVPRATRCHELARELARRGHRVRVVNLSTTGGDAPLPRPEPGVHVDNLALSLYDLSATATGRPSPLVRLVKSRFVNRALFYLTSNGSLLLQRRITHALSIDDDTDMVISVGLPFGVHWGVSKVLRRMRYRGTAVADYGDPFSKGNPSSRVAPYFRGIERRVLREFDYITVPTPMALPAYEGLKDMSRIKVIPQGFVLRYADGSLYRPHSRPTFAYAGRLYSGLREPAPLFEHMCRRSDDCSLVMYVDTNDRDTMALIEPWRQRLGGRLQVHPMIDRDQLIDRLSQMDFLINIANRSLTQVPSKLVDYTLAGRPILSFDSESFDADVFEAFCRGDYSGATVVDISGHDIARVADAFINLCRK